MATLSLNKMKSKLTTRNNFTGRAMDRMTKEKLQNLFHGELNYLSWEEKYIERRFNSAQYLSKIRKERRRKFEKEKEKHIANGTNEKLINLNKMLHDEEQHDIEIEERFKRFVAEHNGEKQLLILDIDNTLIYVRFFSEECMVGDVCTYFGNYQNMEKDNSKIIKIRLTLSLEITNNRLIDIFGTERINHFYWTQSNEEIEHYKTKKVQFFAYPLNENNKVTFINCKIRKVEISGCLLNVFADGQNEEIEIDFTQSNDNLNRFEPMLERDGMLSVDFIYEGFLVRCRPNLDEYFEYICEDFDVVLYTSANKIIYEGLLRQLNILINETLGRSVAYCCWNDVLYRDDCILRYKENGKPYHQKDLSLFGCHLSRVVMVDNSPIVCFGQEPNLILISDFFAKQSQEDDDELMEVYQLLDAIKCIKGDIRYFLCGLEQDENEQNECLEFENAEFCMNLTVKLVDVMKEYYDEQMIDDEYGYADTESENKQIINDYMMDDYDEEDLLQIDELELNVNESESIHPSQIILSTMSDIQTRDRNGSAFIPPKHAKNDSVVSIRNLDVIKLEKAANKKKEISFDGNVDFENKGTAVHSPTRKRKRSSIINSMAPNPSIRAMLRGSERNDFYMALLQQLAVNDEKCGDVLLNQQRQIEALGEKLKKFQKCNQEKSQMLDEYALRQQHYDKCMESMTSQIELYKENQRLSQELKKVNETILSLNEHKLTLQNKINDAISTKLKLLQTTSDQIEKYRQIIQQIANQTINVSLD